MKVTRIDVQVLGERNYPVASARLPEEMVKDLPELLATAQRTNPALTTEDLIRNIWRLGVKRQIRNLQEGVLIARAALPPAPTAPPTITPEAVSGLVRD